MSKDNLAAKLSALLALLGSTALMGAPQGKPQQSGDSAQPTVQQSDNAPTLKICDSEFNERGSSGAN